MTPATPTADNKNNQHRQSVETLSLSGHGDDLIIAEIDHLIHHRQIGQPYSRNCLLRIQLLIEDYLPEKGEEGGPE